MSDDRNPIFIPDAPRKAAPCCPKCKGTNFTGRSIQGLPTFFCQAKGCGNSWQGGGFGQQPIDPRVPQVPDPNPPNVNFVEGPNGAMVEQRRAPDLRSDFRKGAPTGEDE